MEKSNLSININAAFSFLTQGSEEPATSQNNLATGACSLEIPIAAENQSRLKYVCMGMLFHKGPFEFYKACRFSNGKCPLDQYAPAKKVVYEPFEIEKKWAEIKANGK